MVYGEEHWEESSAALDTLARLLEEKPRKYTTGYVQDAWEELNARWREELKWRMTETFRARCTSPSVDRRSLLQRAGRLRPWRLATLRDTTARSSWRGWRARLRRHAGAGPIGRRSAR